MYLGTTLLALYNFAPSTHGFENKNVWRFFLTQRRWKPHVKITRVQNSWDLKLLDMGDSQEFIGQFGSMKSCTTVQMAFMGKMCRTF
jgi:hypothetical protein